MNAILMEEEYWANSYFSIARYYGQIKISGGISYVIVNKFGTTIFELSDPKSKYYVGDDKKAIEPGEPADLVQVEWVPIYKELGRDKFIELIKQKDITLQAAMQLLSEEKRPKTKRKKK